MPETNELSSICPSAHQPALFLIQAGTPCDSEDPDVSVGGITIIPSLIRYWIPCRNDKSSIWSVAHQPALFFIQAGISESCANTLGTTMLVNKKTRTERSRYLIV